MLWPKLEYEPQDLYSWITSPDHDLNSCVNPEPQLKVYLNFLGTSELDEVQIFVPE